MAKKQAKQRQHKFIYSGHYPKGSARNEIKLKTLDLYHYGLEGAPANFPTFTKRQCLKGDNQYIDTYLSDMNDVVNTRKLGITGVIDIYHNRKKYPVDKPYDAWTFNGNTSHFRNGKYWIDDYHGEVEDKLSFTNYRCDLLNDIYSSSHTHGTNRKYDLVNWLTDKSIAFPYGNMAQKRDGMLELLPGYYLRCSHCECTTYLPLSTMLPNTLTRQQVTDFLRQFRDEKECFMPDAEVYGEMAMMIPMCFATSSGECFNCNNDLFSAVLEICAALYSESVAYYSRIRGTQLDELLKLNMLQGAPPDDMPTAAKQYNELHNRQAAKALSKVNSLYINTLYAMSQRQRTDMMMERSHISMSTASRISNTTLEPFEAEEILLIADLASMYVGQIVHYPTNINTQVSLRDVCTTICNGSFFNDLELPIKPTTPPAAYVEIVNGTMDLVNVIDKMVDGAYLLLPREIKGNLYEHVDEEYYYSATTCSTVPVKWSRPVLDIFHNLATLIIDGQHYHVHTVTNGQYMQVVTMTAASDPLHIRCILNYAEFEALVPVYDTSNPLSTLGIFGTKWEYKTINVELLRRLVTFAITADKTSSAIEAYFAGIISTHYTIGGKVVDLTNTPITEGLPEILYAMLILSNNKLVMTWASTLHLHNYSLHNGAINLIDFFINRIAKTFISRLEESNPWFAKVLSSPTEFARQLKDHAEKLQFDTVFKNLMPTIAMDRQYTLGQNMVSKSFETPYACTHHTLECKHSIGQLHCVCCGIQSREPLCDCCSKSSICRHACRHACINKGHFCDKCKSNAKCYNRAICNCCGVYGCMPCVHCPEEPAILLKGPTKDIASKIVPIITNNALKIPKRHQMPAPTSSTIRFEPTGGDACVKKSTNSYTFKSKGKSYTLLADAIGIKDVNDIMIRVDDYLHIPMLAFTGVYYVPITLTDNPISDPVHTHNYCAYTCIAKQTDYTVVQLQNIFGDRPSLDKTEVIELIKSLRLNCLLITNKDEADIIHYGQQSAPYIIIMHGSCATGINHNHWCVGHIPVFNEMPTGYYYPHSLGPAPRDLSRYNMWKAPAAEAAEMSRLVQVIRKQRRGTSADSLQLPTVVDRDGVYWLTNAKEHNPRYGLINTALPQSIDQVFIDALNGVSDKQIDASYANFTNEWSNVEQDIHNSIRLHCLEINYSIRHMEQPTTDLPMSTVDINHDEPTIELVNMGRLKPLDVVTLLHDGKRHNAVVYGEASNPMVSNHFGKGSVLQISKTSLSSTYRALLLAIKALGNLNNIPSMKIVDAVDGVAGSGKSTMIRNLNKKDNKVLVCKTRSAINSHATAGFHASITCEAAGMIIVPTLCVVLDEASMITTVELAALIDHPNMEVYMFGDSMQIGAKDMSPIKGMRQEISLLNQFKCTKLHHTHRFGNPLVANVLKSFNKNITCDDDKTTTYEQISANDYHTVAEIARSKRVDAIYTFMHIDYTNMVSEIGSEISVNKVHSAQGKEFDTVMVLHWGNFAAEGTIVKSANFIFTALTRARKHVIWVLPTSIQIRLNEITNITYEGSGGPDTTLSAFDIESCALTRALTKVEVELLSRIITSNRNYDPAVCMHYITSDSIRIQAQTKYLGSTMNIDFTVDRKGFHPNNTCTNAFKNMIKRRIAQEFDTNFKHISTNGDEIQIDIKQSTVKKPKLTFAEVVDIGSCDSTNINSVIARSRASSILSDKDEYYDAIQNFTPESYAISSVIKSLYLNKSTWSNIIALADVALATQATGSRLQTTIRNEVVYISVFGGCSLYCGFKFLFPTTCVVISSAHNTEGRDGLINTINCANRHICGIEYDVNAILQFITSTQVFSSVPDTLCFTRWQERLTNMAQGLFESCDFSTAGTRHKVSNTELAEQCADYCANWTIPTHQPVDAYFVKHHDHYVSQPSNRQLFSVSDMISHNMGIQGDDAVFDVNAANKKKIEKILIRHMNAEEKFDRPTYVPHMMVKSAMHSEFVQQVGANHLVPTAIGCEATSTLHLAMVVAANVLRQMLDVDKVHHVGVSGQLFCLNHHVGDTISQYSDNDILLIKNMMSSKLNALMERKNAPISQEDQLSIESNIKYYSNPSSIMCFDKESVRIVHPALINDNMLGNTYTCVPITCDATLHMDNDGVIHEIGKNGLTFKLGMGHMQVVAIVGNYYLCKVVCKPIKVQLAGIDLQLNNFRIFKSSLDNNNTIKIPDPIFRRLVARAFAERDTSINDMIAYSRSLLNTMTYTSKGYSYKYTDNPLDLLQFSIVALNFAQRNRKLTSFVQSLLGAELSQDSNNKVSQLLSGALKTIGLQLLQGPMNNLVEAVHDTVSAITNNLPIAKDIYSLLRDVNYVELHPKKQVIIKQNQTRGGYLDAEYDNDTTNMRSVEERTHDGHDEDTTVTEPKDNTTVPEDASTNQARLKQNTHAQGTAVVNTKSGKKPQTRDRKWYDIFGITTTNAAKSRVPKRQVCLLYAGSRGDNQPLNAIAEMCMSMGMSVIAIAPKDIHETIPGVDYEYYIDSYDALTTAGVNQKMPQLSTISDHMVAVYNVWLKHHKVHDYVFSMFFADEADMVHACINNYRIIPQLSETWDPREKLSGAGKWSMVRKLLGIPKPPSLPLWSVPSAWFLDDTNLGYLFTKAQLSVDKATDMALQFCDKHNGNVTLITLGSMVPDNYQSVINNMLNTTSNAVIFVTAKLQTMQNKFEFEGRYYRYCDFTMHQRILIIPKCNYLLLTGKITEAKHHFGAGTYATFSLIGVKQVAYPQAFDQKFNAKHYTNDRGYHVYDPAAEYNRAARLLAKLLNQSLPATTIEVLEFDTLPMPCTAINITKEIQAQRVIVHGLKPLVNNYRVNCVFNVLFDCLADNAKLCTMVESYLTVWTFHTVQDVVALLLIIPTNAVIVGPEFSVKISRKDVTDNVLIQINSSLTHANSFEMESVEPINEMVGASYHHTMLTGEVEADNTFLLTKLSEYETVTMQHAIDNMVKTTMRKSTSIHSVESTCYAGGCKVRERLAVGYKYLCIGSRGAFYALSTSAVDGSVHLVHLQPEVYDCVIAIRLVKEYHEAVATSKGKVKNTSVVAINHATRKKLYSRGICVGNVGVVGADKLYIYDTWAREHHHEMERQVIAEAKEILIVPERNDMPMIRSHNIKSILLSDNYPVCVNKGGTFFRLESTDEVTSRVCCDLMHAKQLTKDLFILPYDDKIAHLVGNAFIYGGTKVTYSNIKEVEIPKNLHAMLALSQIETPSIYRLCENLALQNGYMSLSECPVEITRRKITLEELSLTLRRKMSIFGDVFVIGVNSWAFQIVRKGSGFVYADEQTVLDVTDSKFNVSKYNTISAAARATGIANDMSSLLPIDGPKTNAAQEVKCLAYHAKENQLIIVADVEDLSTPIEVMRFDEIPQANVIDYWNNSELLDSNIILPTNRNFKVTSRIQPIRVKKNFYLTMEDYPKFARPSRSKAYAEELNSITNRHGAYKVHRTVNLNTSQEVDMFCSNYFLPDADTILKQYRAEPVEFNAARCQAWIDKHNMPASVKRDIREMLEMGWEQRPINSMEVHGKTEQTTKLKNARWFNEVVTRSIVAAPYAVSALFAEVFMEMKQRFKSVLRSDVFYSDGSTPAELAALVRQCGEFKYCTEDDLTQQDGQTDRQIINIEMEIYKMLGLSGNVLAFYRQCHDNWKWKGHGISGVWDAMRLSGQVTTALGNAITNLIVHNRFMLRNRNSIKKVLFLGDDIIFLSNTKLKVANHGTETKELYNMVSKVSDRAYVGGFISMIVYNISGKSGICPDYKRMRHRYSVCNYTYPMDETQSKVASRTLSYLFMIGKNQWTQQIVSKLGYQLTLPQWYHQDTAIAANCEYHGETEWETRAHISALRDMLEKQVANRKQIMTWSAV
ncbi:MAG: polyprotein (domains: helicase - caspase/glycosyltransferase - RNA-dependent RNA polymerase) [Tomato associated alphaendornavirus 1]|nr:MAG: polyprotein (domains: helicase - caspase/glycosyltransferase - RNA-dependent RNA polymerase) [Tomato associated alphaendornavirus 1]